MPLVLQFNVDMASELARKVTMKFDALEDRGLPKRIRLATNVIEYKHNGIWVDKKTLLDMLTGKVMDFL